MTIENSMMATRIENKGNTVFFNGNKRTFANILDAPKIIARLEIKPVRESEPVCTQISGPAVYAAITQLFGSEL